MTTHRRTPRIAKSLAVLGVLALLAASALPASATTTGPLKVNGYSVQGRSVSVQVVNQGTLPVSGVVSVLATCGDAPIWSVSPVVLLPGQSANVVVPFDAPIWSVSQVSAVAQ